MVRNSASLVALFALAANGFMIPSTMSLPEINDESLPELRGMSWKEIMESLPSSVPDVPKIPVPKQHFRPSGISWDSLKASISDETDRFDVELPCKDCPLPDDHPHPQHIQTSILKFRVQLDESRTSLLVGGQSVYPSNSAAPFLDTTQETIDTRLRHDQMLDRRTTYALDYTDAFLYYETGSQLTTFRLYLVALDDWAIPSAPYINVQLVKEADGTLHILSVDPFQTTSDASLSVCSGPAFLCNLVSFVETKMASWRSHFHHHKPCRAGRKGDIHFVPNMDVDSMRHFEVEEGEMPWEAMESPLRHYELNVAVGHDRDRSAHNGHHRHHHDRLHSFAMGLHRFLFGFLVPVFIGIAAGMFASVIGMIIGTSVAWLWIRFVRKNRRGPYARVASDATADEAALDPDVKVDLLKAQSAQEEAPPLYVEKE